MDAGTPSPRGRHRRGGGGARGRKAFCAAVAALSMTASAGAGAQARPPDAAPRPERAQEPPDDPGLPGARLPAAAPRPERSQTPRPERVGGAPSPDSLARIRAALAADRDRERSRRTILGPPEDGWIAPPRPSVDLAPGLGFVEGLGLYDDLTRGREPVPMGGPTHRAMLNQMTPREVNEVASTDVLGIGTASAFALVPHAIRKIAAWFSGSGPGPPADPVLTAADEAAVLEDMRANAGVIDADLRQRGRTVALSLLVPAGTAPGAAREMGERFVRLVSRRAGADAVPSNAVAGRAGRGGWTADGVAVVLGPRDAAAGGAGRGGRTADGVVAALLASREAAAGGAGQDAEPGPGAFDYVISVRSPTDAVIARGGKATTEHRVRW